MVLQNVSFCSWESVAAWMYAVIVKRVVLVKSTTALPWEKGPRVVGSDVQNCHQRLWSSFDLSLFSNPNPNLLAIHCWLTWTQEWFSNWQNTKDIGEHYPHVIYAFPLVSIMQWTSNLNLNANRQESKTYRVAQTHTGSTTTVPWMWTKTKHFCRFSQSKPNAVFVFTAWIWW